MSSLREAQSNLSSPLSVISCPSQSYEHGVNTFDTANIYSNGVSEVYLGRAIKALNLPREGIVVMTKVYSLLQYSFVRANLNILQLSTVVGKGFDKSVYMASPAEKDKMGYVNQYGLGRKVGCFRHPSPCHAL